MAFNHQQYNTQYLLNSKDGGQPINDSAEKYGARIVEADVAEGETYWRVIGVHHLLPRENFGNHHVYLDALDEDGNRLKRPPIWVGWTWEGRRPNEPANPVILDKPDYEAGGNLTMHFGQKVSVWVNGTQPDGQDKSDRVENLHTTHPDEPLPDGTLLNTLGHHSFYVVFQRTRKGKIVTNGVITGRVERGQGRKIRLRQEDNVIAEQTLADDLTFKFENLSFGVYQLEIVDTEVSQDNIKLDAGSKELTVNLAVPPPDDSAIFGEVRNGQGKMLLLVKEGNIITRFPLPESGQFRFENLAGGNYALLVFETNVRQDNIVLDGSNTRRIILTVPVVVEAEKTINHYLLFGPPNSRGRQTNLLLALDYILAFSPTVGFNVAEAKLARQVTIVGEGISQADQQAIEASGSEVETLTGDAYVIEAKLNARVQAGRAFGE
ncbi:MAG: hypothetical protein JXM69_01580 [Anaerolineae bacterium]|nr:hypothetical protein [Anaerolineae bacterium]